jgi:hypothetical protein
MCWVGTDTVNTVEKCRRTRCNGNEGLAETASTTHPTDITVESYSGIFTVNSLDRGHYRIFVAGILSDDSGDRQLERFWVEANFDGAKKCLPESLRVGAADGIRQLFINLDSRLAVQAQSSKENSYNATCGSPRYKIKDFARKKLFSCPG